MGLMQAGRQQGQWVREEALEDVELGAVGAMHAFQRWMMSCMSAAGLRDLTPVDVLVLHHINHRGTDKGASEICFVLNIEDVHIVTYSLHKLARLEVISAEKHGKEVTYTTTPQGQEYLSRYTEIRERGLIDMLTTLGLEHNALEELAQYLRRMSGLYDQAARAASSL